MIAVPFFLQLFFLLSPTLVCQFISLFLWACYAHAPVPTLTHTQALFMGTFIMFIILRWHVRNLSSSSCVSLRASKWNVKCSKGRRRRKKNCTWQKRFLIFCICRNVVAAYITNRATPMQLTLSISKSIFVLLFKVLNLWCSWSRALLWSTLDLGLLTFGASRSISYHHGRLWSCQTKGVKSACDHGLDHRGKYVCTSSMACNVVGLS